MCPVLVAYATIFLTIITSFIPFAHGLSVYNEIGQGQLPEGRLLQILGKDKTVEIPAVNEPNNRCTYSNLKPDFDPEPFYGGDFWSCGGPSGDRYIGIEVDFENVRPLVPAMIDERDLFTALEEGASAMAEAAKQRPPPIPPSGAHSDVNVTSGDAILHFEGFPCMGEETISLMHLPIEQIEWSELGVALGDLLDLLKVRSSQGRKNNSGVGRIIRIRDPVDTSSWSDLGGFNIQSKSVPYRKLTELFPIAFECYGKPTNLTLDDGANGDVGISKS
ncbi:uncharacterized protein KY384_000376 [Bacidia gigantensis]|uniref:uncharacterized protein n=1 Tax=Bacidia gigantensis TaxID=2732470 RepID=UPI001D05A0BC|nr:uncharacterized protein KY384_000376 [Bacidia gigantensis]KAG8526382.1 hypothetical protein KY384_000376 [Bacidia gigantensis]